MIVEIDPDSGFCYGVVRAIRMAENELQSGNTLFSLGDIVHNEPEVARLNRCGMHTINHHDLQQLRNVKVLIRAHGEPPETYCVAADNDISIADATCPVVLNLQKKVHRAYLESQANTGQVIIYGKPGHAEVNGLVGQTENTAIVINSVEEAGLIDVTRPVYLFAQTTMTIEGLQRIRAAIEQKRNGQDIGNEVPFQVNDTICRQVSNREPHLVEFARRHDVVIFVSGSKSSNGKALYEVCLNANPCTHMVATPKDIDMKWFAGASDAGVCGATSTPRWLMEEVAAKILGN
ncbi:MAG: 4-hydroxy-3-methylbut-2-enyl diphosphate reductase [Bacteroidales bacterium]|nr:4-hydroxy-3-methylbut-2-enyl diphosphate reductase [Bacteroidales bacterium]